ncbi:MAG: class II aldolase/adducin family protein [Proteobacteria bacterium]|nr:class II aldolase/adducin family protein [Pseudomonadota bacterium]
MRAGVVDFCVKLSGDPLLVQGAGGNVSWKDGDTLWIKASGTGLADAAAKPIFLPVDLRHLQEALAGGDYSAAPRVLGDTPLRPSIETLLHGFLPHRLVVHLHAVEILAHLVRRDGDDTLAARLPSSIRWASVPYAKPGAALARALVRVLAPKSGTDVVFLHNHGVVIGGASVGDVEEKLRLLVQVLATPPRNPGPLPDPEPCARAAHGYQQVTDPGIDQLARDPWLFTCLSEAWALYPEQVVFLGAEPVTCARLEDLPALGLDHGIAGAPPVFVRGTGVFIPPGFGAARLALLRCYYEVLARQNDIAAIRTLTTAEVAELLDWDAEKYRAKMAH